jgi:hypothetical protein
MHPSIPPEAVSRARGSEELAMRRHLIIRVRQIIAGLVAAALTLAATASSVAAIADSTGGPFP